MKISRSVFWAFKLCYSSPVELLHKNNISLMIGLLAVSTFQIVSLNESHAENYYKTVAPGSNPCRAGDTLIPAETKTSSISESLLPRHVRDQGQSPSCGPHAAL